MLFAPHNEELTTLQLSSLSASEVSNPLTLSTIFPLCALMYGSIGMMWALHALQNKGLPAKTEVTKAYIGLLIATWGACSVGMHVLNKSLADSLQAPSIISSIQMFIALIVFGFLNFREFLEADRREMMVWLVVPFFFAAMLCSSFYTYQYISLSLLTVVRNLTPLMVMPMESLVMPKDKQPYISSAKVVALLLMLSGAAVYSGGLSDISIIGICFAVGNMFFAGSDRLIQRRLLTEECKSLTSSVCAIINNGVAILPAMLLAFATSEVQGMSKPENAVNWQDPRVMILLFLSGFVGIGICYIGFELQRAISATSFAVMQNVSKVAVVTCGIVVFGDPIKSPMCVAGLVLSLSGSFIYSQAPSKPPTPNPPVDTATESNRSAV